ncbi:unnamed protein product [Discosporangium mesarthrocarpum]
MLTLGSPDTQPSQNFGRGGHGQGWRSHPCLRRPTHPAGFVACPHCAATHTDPPLRRCFFTVAAAAATLQAGDASVGTFTTTSPLKGGYLLILFTPRGFTTG